MREPTVAVIDIGMTHKKVAVYDTALNQRAIARRTFDPITAEGIPAHDLAGMESWFIGTLRGFSRAHDIRAIAVTTHGATMVCTDDRGNPVVPCVLYTHEPGPAFHDEFFRMAGDPAGLQRRTGTPDFSALINPAKGLFFLSKRFPERYASAARVLPYPQYWGMRFTGNAGAEGTYIGCHTYLWDWIAGEYSEVASRLGIRGKLPPKLCDSWSVLGRLRPEFADACGLPPGVIVTMGIHDSNASLLPYLVTQRGRDFVLDSTGSWCVLMHPQETYGFSAADIGKVVFFNRAADNRPVKTAIFTGGLEYEAWSGRMAPNADAAEAAKPDEPALARLLRDRDAFILPELVPGSGQFPGSRARAAEFREGLWREYPFAATAPGAERPAGSERPGFFSDPAKARAALDLSLAIQTLAALERAGLRPGADLFIEGGFRNNAEYCGLIAAALPENHVYLSDKPEATSFGAAMTAVAALEGISPDELAGRFDIERVPVAPLGNRDHLIAYRDAWLRLAGAEEKS